MWNSNWKYCSWAPAWLVERTELPLSRWGHLCLSHPVLYCANLQLTSLAWDFEEGCFAPHSACWLTWHLPPLSLLVHTGLLRGLQEEFAQDTKGTADLQQRGKAVNRLLLPDCLFSAALVVITTGYTTAQKTARTSPSQTVWVTLFSLSWGFFSIFPSAPSWAFHPKATWPPFHFPVKVQPWNLTMQHSLPCLWASSDILHNFSPYSQHSFIPRGSLRAGGFSPAAAGCWQAPGDPTPEDILFHGEQQGNATSTKHNHRKNVLSLNLMQEKGKTMVASPRKGSSNVQQNSSTPVFNIPIPCLHCFPQWGCYPQDHSSSPNCYHCTQA